MAINTVIFDFDGTLADTNRMILDSWQYTYKTLQGAEEKEENILKTFGEPLALSMEKAFPDIPTSEAIAVYRSFQEKHFEEMIRPFPGMVELIRKLRQEGCKVGIVTSRLRNTTVRGLAQFGLLEDIDEIITCEDTEKHKPEPEPALEALSRLGAKAEETVMVGDSLFDIRCAHGAGIRAILVGWAMAIGEEDKQGEDAPDAQAGSAEELLSVLRAMK